MNAICLIDTTVLLNLLNVPNRSQNSTKISKEFADLRKQYIKEGIADAQMAFTQGAKSSEIKCKKKKKYNYGGNFSLKVLYLQVVLEPDYIH